MNKKLFGLILAVVLMVTILAGCGAKSESSYDTASSSPMESQKSSLNSAYGGDNGATETEEKEMESPAAMEADSLAGSGSASIDVSNAILAERKIIRSANLTIEVENFDSAFNNIDSIILGIGIIQETNINTDRVYIEDELKLVKNGTIVLRVDKSKFDSVISKLKGIGNVFNYTTNGQDVTDQYVDVESRLRLLRLEQGKLEAYLAKLDDLDKIFKAESKLTEIRYEIERLTGNLNKLSSLVELSTITITMNEKHPGYDPKPVTYGQKLLNSLKDSLMEVVEFLGDLLIFVVAAMPVLIVLGLFILLGMFIYKRIPKKSKDMTPVVKPDHFEDKKGQ